MAINSENVSFLHVAVPSFLNNCRRRRIKIAISPTLTDESEVNGLKVAGIGAGESPDAESVVSHSQ
jgi:hypothetical protein